MFYLRVFFAGLWFLASSAVGLGISLLRWGDPSNGHRFGKICGWGTLPCLGISVQVTNAERLEQCQPCIYVANHQSNIDLFTFGSIYPRRTVVIGKKELIRVPVFGLMFKAMGNILLDRGQRVLAISMMSKAAERIRQESISVWVFPEGHRNPNGGLLPFKKGGFYLALEAKVAVVPVVCADLRRALRQGGVLHMEVLEPIATVGREPDAILQETRERMQQALDRINVVE